MPLFTDISSLGRFLEIVAMILIIVAILLAFFVPDNIRWQPFGSRLAFSGMLLSAAISGRYDTTICYAFVVGCSLYYIIAIVIAIVHHSR